MNESMMYDSGYADSQVRIHWAISQGSLAQHHADGYGPRLGVVSSAAKLFTMPWVSCTAQRKNHPRFGYVIIGLLATFIVLSPVTGWSPTRKQQSRPDLQ